MFSRFVDLGETYNSLLFVNWQALGVAPENCLVVEDSVIGLKVFMVLLSSPIELFMLS